MPDYQVQVTIWPTSNLLVDASTNSWSIFADDDVALESAVDELKIFYGSIVTLYPNTVRQTDHTIKCYDRADPIPRAPILEDTFDFPGAPTGISLPPEVSLCLSFQAPPLSGQPQSRRRGRVYIGPLKNAGQAASGRPDTSIINLLVGAGDDFLAASLADTTWVWDVWSTVNNGAQPVANGWVDDEYDTQRRRGRVATARTTFP